MVVVDWREYRSGALRGFLSVDTPSGFRISRIAVFEKDGNWWTALPTKPRLRDGVATKSDRGGWVSDPIVEIPDKSCKSAFDIAVMAALRRFQDGGGH